MPEAPDSPTPDADAVRARLDEVTRLLGPADAVGPELRRDLVGLTQELRRALDAGAMTPAEAARLADSALRLAQGLRQRQDEGVLGRARDRLEEAVLAAEARHPVV